MSINALPFVGRAALLEEARTHLRQGRHVIFQGPAGVGKTRLALETLRTEAAASDQRIQPDPRPVDRLLADEARAQVLLGVLAPVGPPASVTVEDQAAVFGWFLRHWRARTTPGRPVVVWVDDLQHCDPLSAAILRHAVASSVVQLIATHRTSEPLGPAAQSMVGEGLLVPVAVDPLDRSASEALARAALAQRPEPSKLDASAFDRLLDLAAGNPLFLRELVAGVNGGVDLRASTTLVGLIERPLHSLSESCRRTLEMVAVAEPAPERLLASRRHDLRVLQRQGLVACRDDTVLIDHPLRRAWVRRDIGSGLPEVLGGLVDLVEASGCHDEIDPTRLTDWQLRAGRIPEPEELQRATRLAIARRDGATALRFAEAVQGPAGDLLRGQALVTSGRLADGVERLARAATDGPAAVRAEAAFAQATYLGLMVGDFPRAHAALDAVEDPELPSDLRRYVIGGRLWLCIFGPIGDVQFLDLAKTMALQGPDDPLAFELCHSVVALLHQVTSEPADVLPFLVRCAELEAVVGLSPTASGRWQAVQASWELSQGHAHVARRALLAALEHADANQDYETVALLVGNASWLLALMGRLREAATVGGLLRSVPPTEDWYSFRTLAVLVNRGNTQLLAEDVVSMPLTTRAPRVGADIGRLFATRSEILRQEAIGEKENQGALLATLALLVGNGKHLWAALFGLEVTSLATSRDVHELLWMSSQQMRGRGVVSVGGAAARARLDGDGVRLVECAQHLEWAGLHALALRVSADAARLLAPHTEQGTRARAAVLRARREFDGRDPRWLEDVDHLPTPRQMDVVWKVVDGATASDVAAELVLSTRTVENHLHRVYATLGVHGRDELVDILRPPPRPPGWRLGEF